MRRAATNYARSGTGRRTALIRGTADFVSTIEGRFPAFAFTTGGTTVGFATVVGFGCALDSRGSLLRAHPDLRACTI